MGAEYFETFVKKTKTINTVKLAFDAAQEEAMWQHGSGGYTGSIAEKYNDLVNLGNINDQTIDDQRIADKWGKTGYAAKKDGWLFVGWASS